MTSSAGIVTIGPEQGRICIRTTREGMAAKVGHDLEIEFGAWSGELVMPDRDVAPTAVSVRIEVGSFTVVSGTGGVNALTDGDRAEITRNALKVLDAERHPIAEFRSDHVRQLEGSGELQGTLQIAGKSAPASLHVTTIGPGQWRATGVIAQTALGIKPYRAFLGALRLADAVGIEAEVTLTGS
jgi:polyisoprenoid-binding protein YceI